MHPRLVVAWEIADKLILTCLKSQREFFGAPSRKLWNFVDHLDSLLVFPEQAAFDRNFATGKVGLDDEELVVDSPGIGDAKCEITSRSRCLVYIY